jgi:hypothetical protein
MSGNHTVIFGHSTGGFLYHRWMGDQVADETMAKGAIVGAIALFFLLGPFSGLLGVASAQGLPPGVTEADLEAAIAEQLVLEMPSLLVPGTLVIDEFCYADLFGSCIGSADISISNSPAPGRGAISVV